ncbi:uncharacterized protein AB675_7337 [Cyphellophora attinorum]|uniref:Uncharacterized protein n=1 Tax=Cyphellophora attinorum TaxID=1664694 RepID=A0A0N1H4M0_9EURO|nr:uncharacterized protein AB675_7337 [Phialophora attinorum]KPI36292.1 hypothetical protein AB675_7337 [Phialophora attinorum]
MAHAESPTWLVERSTSTALNGDWRHNISNEGLVVEAWGQGFIVGSLIIMACVTVANMRKGVLLHKLILLELLLAIPHGTFAFMAFDGYSWYLSSTASLLYTSYFIHNVVAWIKIRPFIFDPTGFMFSPRTATWVSRIYIGTLAATIAPMLLQIVSNFLFFNGINDLYERVRPTETTYRDPWWLFSTLALFYVLRKCYGSSVFTLIGKSPRLGILLVAMCLAMVFTLMDILATTVPGVNHGIDGINVYWKLALVFKCLTDNIMLDDFKTELKKLGGVNGLTSLGEDEQHSPGRDRQAGRVPYGVDCRAVQRVETSTSESTVAEKAQETGGAREVEQISFQEMLSGPRSQPRATPGELMDVGGLA